MSKVVLDHIKRIELDAESPPLDNYQALQYLPVGMRFPAITVRHEELEVSKRLSGKIANPHGA